MKLNKLVYSIKEALRDYSDDTDLDDRFIIFLLDTKRAQLVSQKLNSYTTAIPRNAVQNVCVDLVEVNRYKCGIDITCDTLLRTSKPLPKVFDTVSGNALLSVRSLDRIGRPFSIISTDMVPYVEYSTYNERVFAFLDDDNYLYMYSTSGSHKFLECVEASGVFETPMDLAEFSNCCGCSTEAPCFSMEDEYPIPGEMVSVIKEMVIKDIVKLKNLPTDDENDGAAN